MVRIVSFVLALSVVSTPAVAEEIKMSCHTSIDKSLGLGPTVFKYTNPFFGSRKITVRYKGKWVRWCSPEAGYDKDWEYSVKVTDRYGVCRTKAGKYRHVTHLDFEAVRRYMDNQHKYGTEAKCRLLR